MIFGNSSPPPPPMKFSDTNNFSPFRLSYPPPPHSLTPLQPLTHKVIKREAPPGVKILVSRVRGGHFRSWSSGEQTLMMRVSSYSLINFRTARNQCCGSGSVGSACFWASWIRIRIRGSQVRIRIRLGILPSSSKLVRKPLISTGFVASL
jgi:hypothetical protein